MESCARGRHSDLGFYEHSSAAPSGTGLISASNFLVFAFVISTSHRPSNLASSLESTSRAFLYASLLWYDYGCLELASAAYTEGCDDWRIS